MPSPEITVGTPQLVVHDGQTVWIAEPDGQVPGQSERGLVFRDTRLISYWRLYANGVPWQLVSGAAMTHYAGRVFLTNVQPIPAPVRDIPANTLSLELGRWVNGGVHEDFDITNHGSHAVRFNLELSLRCDFADLFEVKSGRLVRRGRITATWSDHAQSLRTLYANRDFERGTIIFVRAPEPAAYANGRISLDVALEPGARWHACLLTEIIDCGKHIAAPAGCLAASAESPPAKSLAAWRHEATKLQTVNEEFYRLYAQAVDDVASLRQPLMNGHHTHIVPAAGLPWFAALFGRDSLIVSLQTAPVTIEFGRGVLAALGDHQATETDDYRDAEPGKILHEMRYGELAHFGLVPHTPYYGTADATLLYPIVLHTVWRWTGERALLERHMPTAERCLHWIDHFGDRDGDGFQEYQTRSPQGYENMGWKDAGDAVLYPDGSPVKGPKALCELQGYVYAAWQGMAELYDVTGDHVRAAELRQRAAHLFNRFNEVFWDEELGFYVFALDGDKRPVRSIASNPGHCLWAGIVPPERARRVMERLMAPDMFSGWGIRTLSAEHSAFNPYAYHNGSVWPHDNGLIAQGFKRYGFTAEAAQLARAVSGAAGFFARHQVPELFAGMAREANGFPVQCLGANLPQAWAAGSAFSFLQAILGLDPDAAKGVLRVDPSLPSWLPELTLSGLTLGNRKFDIRFWREGEKSRFEVTRGEAKAVRGV